MSDSRTISIEKASPADAPDLAALGTATFIEKFGHLYAPQDLQAFLAGNHQPQHYERLISNPEFGVWIARDFKGTPAAYAVAGLCNLPVPSLEPHAGEVKRLYVASKFQSAGLGRQLMNIMLNWLEAEGFRPLYISVYAENFGAHRFYERYGFEKILDYEFEVGEHRDPEFIYRRKQGG